MAQPSDLVKFYLRRIAQTYSKNELDAIENEIQGNTSQLTTEEMAFLDQQIQFKNTEF